MTRRMTDSVLGKTRTTSLRRFSSRLNRSIGLSKDSSNQRSHDWRCLGRATASKGHVAWTLQRCHRAC